MGTHPIFESDFDCLTDCERLIMSEGSGLDKAILGDVAMCLKTMLLNPDRGGDTKNEISLPDNPVLHIKNFLELIIEHYPNHLGIIKQYKLVLNNIGETRAGASPFNELKGYYQQIHNLSKKLGGLDPVREFKYLGHRTSKENPRASGTWFLLHFISIKLADINENMSHTGSQVNTDLPRDAVIGSQEWKTLKEFFTHFYGEFEFRRTWQNLCEYYEETEDISNNDTWMFTMWRLHNAVNMRLARNNSTDKYRDYRYPESMWPPALEKDLLVVFEAELDEQFDDGYLSKEEKAVLHMNINYNLRTKLEDAIRMTYSECYSRINNYFTG